MTEKPIGYMRFTQVELIGVAKSLGWLSESEVEKSIGKIVWGSDSPEKYNYGDADLVCSLSERPKAPSVEAVSEKILLNQSFWVALNCASDVSDALVFRIMEATKKAEPYTRENYFSSLFGMRPMSEGVQLELLRLMKQKDQALMNSPVSIIFKGQEPSNNVKDEMLGLLRPENVRIEFLLAAEPLMEDLEIARAISKLISSKDESIRGVAFGMLKVHPLDESTLTDVIQVAIRTPELEVGVFDVLSTKQSVSEKNILLALSTIENVEYAESSLQRANLLFLNHPSVQGPVLARLLALTKDPRVDVQAELINIFVTIRSKDARVIQVLRNFAESKEPKLRELATAALKYLK